MKLEFLAGLIGSLLGVIVAYWFLIPKPETTIVIEEKIVTDTSYRHLQHRLRIDSIKQVSLADSLEIMKKKYAAKLAEKKIEIVPESEFEDTPFKAPIRRFSGAKPFLYGMMSFDATVAGELLDIQLSNDFKLPTVTNTITKKETVTKTVYPKGFYAGAGISSAQGVKIGANYVDKEWIFGYDYELNKEVHWATIRKRVF